MPESPRRTMPRGLGADKQTSFGQYTPVISTLQSRHQPAADALEFDESEPDGLAPDGSESEPDDWRRWLKQVSRLPDPTVVFPLKLLAAE